MDFLLTTNTGSKRPKIVLVFRKDPGETEEEKEQMRIRRLVAGSCKLNDSKLEKPGSIELNLVKSEQGA